LTGGDPLTRLDLFELIDRAHTLGIGVSITPASTPKLTRDVLVRLKRYGIEGLGLSIDGSTAARHDSIRNVPGTFALTIQALRWAGELEMPVQVNSLVAAERGRSAGHLRASDGLCNYALESVLFDFSRLGGRVLEPVTPDQGERLMEWIFRTSRVAPFTVATPEAPSYRRVVLQRMQAEGLTGDQIKSTGFAGFGVRDGHGVMFVSQTGDICPAGFLPLRAGNVRNDRIATVYRATGNTLVGIHPVCRRKSRKSTIILLASFAYCAHCVGGAATSSTPETGWQRRRELAGY
jgi:AdoMet-dependent heme synthase